MATVAQSAITCELCSSTENVKFFCVECQEILCGKCMVIHSKSRKTKNDEIISISDGIFNKHQQSPVTLCSEHTTQEISLFCLQCERFICTECVDETHDGHKVTTSKKIKKKQNELVNFVEELKNKQDVLNKALHTENNVHTQNTKCFDHMKQEISDHVTEIVKELEILEEEKFSEISLLQQEENQRHTDACNNIESQTQTLATAIQLVQTAIESGVIATMEKAVSDATQLAQNCNEVTAPQMTSTKYRPGDIGRSIVVPLFGDILFEDKEARPKKTQTEVASKKGSQVKKHQSINKIGLKATINVRDTENCIKVIVPIKNNCIWVAAEHDKHLTLLNKNGVFIRKSIEVCDGDSHIIDAKMYSEDLLLTCYNRHQVLRLSADGKSKTTFCDMCPYYPYGLCVTHEMDTLVCLGSTIILNDKNTKVVRLDRKGEVIHTVQKDPQGASLYSFPFSVTSLLTGEILVSDKDKHKRVLCVNSLGHQMFTWNGKIKRRKVDKFDPKCITHDKNNNVFITDFDNNKVFMLSNVKYGMEANCLLNSTHGINNPYGIAVDSDGQLWVGCAGGNLHQIKF